MKAMLKKELPVTREDLQQLLGEYAFTGNLGLSVRSFPTSNAPFTFPSTLTSSAPAVSSLAKFS